MKKLILLMFIVFVSSSVFCQDASSVNNGWKFGLHATPSVKWLSSTKDSIETDGAQAGFAYGLVAEYFFQNRYSFCTGIDFAYRGGKLKYETSTGSEGKLKSNIQYVELPVTIKMHTNKNNKKLFYAKFGVSPGWKISATGDALPEQNDKISDFYCALKIGGGMEYEISDQTMLFGGLVWNNGFTDAYNADQVSAKNKCVALEIGVLF